MARTTLNIGDVLLEEETLESADGLSRVRLEGDGRLILYWRRSTGVDWQYMPWQTPNSDSGPHYLMMQGDGNLCIYAGIPSDQGPLKWQSGVAPGVGRAYQAILQDDGNFCVYPNATGGAIWCTRCARKDAGAVRINTWATNQPYLMLSGRPPDAGAANGLSIQNPDDTDLHQQFGRTNIVLNDVYYGMILTCLANGLAVCSTGERLASVALDDQMSPSSILALANVDEPPSGTIFGIRTQANDVNHFCIAGDGPYNAGLQVIVYPWDGQVGYPSLNFQWGFSSV